MRSMKRLAIAVLLAAVAGLIPAAAQITATTTLSTQYSAPCTATSCVTYKVDGPSITVDAEVTGTITLTFYQSLDGETYRAVGMTNLLDGSLSSTLAADGSVSMSNTGVAWLQVRATTVSGGTAVVRSGKGKASARGGGGTGGGGVNLSASTIALGNGSAGSPSLLFTADTPGSGAGLYRPSVGDLGLLSGGVARMAVDGASIQLRSAQTLDWSSGEISAASDTTLSRGAANRLDLATGDSFNLVSGGLSVGAGAITTAGRLGALTFQLTAQASPPGTPAAGYMYVDTTGSELCFYDGAAWQGISTGTDANCA